MSILYKNIRQIFNKVWTTYFCSNFRTREERFC